MNCIALYMLFFIQLLNAEFSFSFIKSPFQCNRLHPNDNANKCVNKIKYFIQNLCNHKNNKEIRKPAILEIPIELDEKWEEGEIPWDFVDNNKVTTTNNSTNNNANNSNNGTRSIDADKLAFLLL